MKYIKTYEGYGYRWENIVEKNGKLYIKIYKLRHEMEDYANKIRENKKITRGGYSIPDDKEIVSNMEIEYEDLIKKLLKNKVISFKDSELIDHFGICNNITFDSGPSGGIKEDQYTFLFEYLCIKLDEWYNLEGEEEEVIVHLDIDPETYKNKSKFNL